jgi:hypothetical protein
MVSSSMFLGWWWGGTLWQKGVVEQSCSTHGSQETETVIGRGQARYSLQRQAPSDLLHPARFHLLQFHHFPIPCSDSVSINRLFHWWRQSLHDPMIAQMPHFWILLVNIKDQAFNKWVFWGDMSYLNHHKYYYLWFYGFLKQRKPLWNFSCIILFYLWL